MSDPFQSHPEEPGIETSFVGRTRELEFLQRALVSDSQEVVIVQGPRGAGKTTLLWMFGEQMHYLFPGGYESTYGFDLESPVAFARRRFRFPLSGRALLTVDDAHEMTAEARSELEQFLPAHPRLNLLLAAARPLSLETILPETIVLTGLSESEYFELLSRRLTNVDPEIARQLWESAEGNALVGNLASQMIRENTLTWDELFQGLQDFRYPGILRPDGQPIEPSAPVPSQIILAASNTNAEIIEMLRRDPSQFRSLSPRKFEEIVAELLSRMGYEIELTPFSGDGGFDMYAARSDALGRFLYLVECKRYVPPNKVGVDIVRSLYGVVAQKRASAGVIATTSFFTRGAKEFQQEQKYQMHLRDYLELRKWLKETK